MCYMQESSHTKRNAKMVSAGHVDPSASFSFFGIHCFGPFLTKPGPKDYQRYGLIFTFSSLRPIHTETLEDLTTDTFINVLQCFITICGAVRQIRLDEVYWGKK